MKPHGMTLVSTLIGLTISLLVISAILSLYFSYYHSYHQHSAGPQQLSINSQQVQHFLQRQLQLTGHRSTPSNGLYFPSIKDTFTAGYLAGENNTGPNNSDQITYAIQGNGALTDCLNNPIADGSVATNTLRISNNQLLCNDIALFNNIINLQVQYGSDTDEDRIIDRYQTASQATMANVSSIKIALLLQGENNSAQTTSTQQHSLLDETIITNNNRAHQTLIFTIPLRNITP